MTLEERIAEARERARDLDSFDARRVQALYQLAEADAALRKARKHADAAEAALASEDGGAMLSNGRRGVRGGWVSW